MDTTRGGIRLRYGKGEVGFDPPGGISWRRLQKRIRPAPAERSEQAVVARGLEPLRRSLSAAGCRPGERLLLVVPDATRRCGLERLLPPLARMLEESFSARIEALIACGTHARVGEDEAADLVGREFHSRYPVRQHDCRNEAGLVACGLTRRGTPVLLNRRLLEADRVIAVGGVLYHYFAGFGGGPKMIFPGLAGYESVRANHSLCLDLGRGRLHPGCREGELDANPVYQDLAEAAGMAGDVLSWQLLLDPAGGLRHSLAGPLLPTHRRICRRAAALFSLPCPAPADIVLASAGGHPADVDLVQAHKAIRHAFAALKPGGWLVMLAECGRGAGSDTLAACLAAGPAAEIARRLRQEYLLNGQTALSLRGMAEAARIVLVSALDPALARRAGLIPAASLGEAWEVVRQAGQACGTGLIFPEAGRFVPRPA